MNENKWIIRGRVLWLYIKYQVVSKLLVGLFAFPIFAMISDFLINESGRTNLSNGDYLGFVFSIYGLIVIILGILLLIFILGMDINTFIIISSLVEENKLKIRMKNILFTAFKSLKHFFSPVGIFLVLFVAFILPIIGFSVSMGPLKSFKIPNFITSVIFNNPLYNTLYIIALTILSIISIIYIFTIHFMLVDGKRMADAMRSSRKLIFKYWKSFLKDYILKILQLTLVCLGLIIVSVLILILFSYLFSFVYSNIISSAIFLLLAIGELVSFFAFISVPIIISILTKLFYKYNSLEDKKIHLRLDTQSEELPSEDTYRKIKVKTKVQVISFILLVLIVNLSMSILAEAFFDDVFKTTINIELIGHRAGGDLEAENTTNGIEEAIKAGASWAEIDVQRTKDGKYVINHDKTFARTSGVDKTPMEMTFDEIRELNVKNDFDESKLPRKVASFEEILDVSKGKIGVFVELKGKSADHQMVDDVVKMIEEKGMLDECVILSLNYDIIEYTDANYPQIKTGFLYFFSTGELKDLKGDYLIMEEREATSEKIGEIHRAGKKAIVWTVNTEESIQKFIYSEIDGIITDHLGLINEAIEKSKNRSHIEIVIDSFIN